MNLNTYGLVSAAYKYLGRPKLMRMDKIQNKTQMAHFERNLNESITLKAESATAKIAKKAKSNIRLVIPAVPSSVCLAASLA